MSPHSAPMVKRFVPLTDAVLNRFAEAILKHRNPESPDASDK